MLSDPLKKHSRQLKEIAEKNDISYLALYGSYARGEQRKNSDFDLLVDFNKEKGLLDLASIEERLSNVLGIKVNLVTRKGLSKYIKPYIQDDLKVIYAKES